MEGVFVQWGPEPDDSGPSSQPVAFLDRDGVLNLGKEGYVNGPDEVELLKGAGLVVGALKEAGYLVCVVTNQSPIQRGLWGPERLGDIHHELQRQLLGEHSKAAIDLFLACPHRFKDGCACRKPSPGMLRLGHQMLREEIPTERQEGPFERRIESPVVDWWGKKPSSPHPLDLMVGDRRSDMGAGWAFGCRLFRVNASIGLTQVQLQWLNDETSGDSFQP